MSNEGIYILNHIHMGKKKEKKRLKALKNRTMQEKIFDFLVDGKPMSQIVHWTVIFAVATAYATKFADAAVVLNNIPK